MYVLVVDPRRSLTTATIAYHISQTSGTNTIVLDNEPIYSGTPQLSDFERDFRDFEEALNEARRRRGLPSYTRKRFAPLRVHVPRSVVVPRRRPRSWIQRREPCLRSRGKYGGSWRRKKRYVSAWLRFYRKLEKRQAAV